VSHHDLAGLPEGAHGGSAIAAQSIAAVAVQYAFVWVCLGEPRRPIVTFAECLEPDRLVATAGSVRVAVSAMRAVENFLDLSHLAFVHAGFLGEEPHTEIEQYSVATLAEGGIMATGCRVYQPKPSPVESKGFDVDYVYTVLRPLSVVLYKANPVEQARKDMIALFVQPVSEQTCVAHILTCYLPHDVHPPSVRRFQQFIFGQDRPILENQIPKRLPLDARAELSVRADLSSAAYRRWLAALGVRFGADAGGVTPWSATARSRWFPVARSEEVIHRHVVQTQLLGQEIAVWRDDTGAVNAWENRCPHRGVRLSLGLNTGTELRCRYHGWRFASGSGQCTFIPAHPRQKPASAMRAGVFGALERHDYVWVRLEPDPDPNADADAPISPLAQFAQLAPGSAMTLRSIFVEAPADAVAAVLLRGYRLAPVIAEDPYTYAVTDGGATLRFLLQPVTESQTVIHAFLTPPAAAGERLAVLRHHNAQMSALRGQAERLRAGAARSP
jgi:phenylpropionate dioxygenase-like ring-hydroxylating dioxygenase large terminal subunit